MSEVRPYTMIMMAVFGLISAFIYAREPSPQVAENSAIATPIYGPTSGQFPVLAGGGQVPVTAAPSAVTTATQVIPGIIMPKEGQTPQIPGQPPGLVRRVPPPPVPYTGGVQTAVPMPPPGQPH